MCSGIHRQFSGHVVCTISLTKFRPKMVEELEKGGNKRAEEKYLALYKSSTVRDISPESIKTFIRCCFEDRIWMARPDLQSNEKQSARATRSSELRISQNTAPNAIRSKQVTDELSQHPSDGVEEEELHAWQNGDGSEPTFTMDTVNQDTSQR
uniref:Putative ADP-ribosylation factor GTPase-activating protein AGD14 n=1 Tax=Lygus hesperus TaxID=30085 RepID=A0A0A9XD38_LYGHE